MKKILLFAFIVFVVNASAQTVTQKWVQFGADVGYKVKTDGSGNVYVAGTTNTSNANAYVAKYNSSGVNLWLASYDGPEGLRENLVDMKVDGSGNVYVTGWSYVGTNPGVIFTIKYNSSGARQWVARYGAMNARSIPDALVVDGSGNVYVVGIKGLNPLPNGTYYSDNYGLTLKYNSSGVLQWEQAVATRGSENTDVKVDVSGNVYVCGKFEGPSEVRNFKTYKYDASGVLQWQRDYARSGRVNDAWKIALDPGGNIFVTGTSIGPGSFSYTYDFMTVRYAPDGTASPGNIYINVGEGGIEYRAKMFLASDASGNIFVGGTQTVNATPRHNNYILIKYSYLGPREWVASYNSSGSAEDRANDMALDNTGNIYLTGYSAGSYATVKYNTNAALAWAVRYSSPQGYVQQAIGIAIYSSSSPVGGVKLPVVYVVGSTGLSGLPTALVKYEQTSGVGSVLDDVPAMYDLSAYPNPFRGATTVRYSLPKAGDVNLVMRDVAGRVIRVLERSKQSMGTYSVDVGGQMLPKGMYYVQMTANSFKKTVAVVVQ